MRDDSRSPVRNGRGRSRSVSGSPRRRSPRPRSRSRDRHERRYSRSRSRSPRRSYRRSRSRSPYSRGGRLPPPSRGGRYRDGRDNPQPCRCLGVFGMSLHTTERDLRKAFGVYGEIESVQIVYDRNSGRSRGFGFIYYESTRDAAKAKEHMREAVIDGMRVRVDYSVTKVGSH